MLHTVYFDLETKRSASEVGGWGNIIDMGMSCGVLYDTREGGFFVYLDHQVFQLIAHLQRAELVVGFNHIGFDYTVLAGCKTPGEDQRKRCYGDLCALNNLDMLMEIHRKLGHRVKLDAVARPTLAVGKSADGLQALEWWRQGRLDLIIEYCKQDVEVTRRVHEYALEHGKLLYDSREGIREVALDWRQKKPEIVASEQMDLF